MGIYTYTREKVDTVDTRGKQEQEAGMLEKEVEKYLMEQVKKHGGLTYKFTAPGTRAVPDRIVLKSGRTYFIELKRPGKEPRKDQLKMIDNFAKQNIPIQVIDTKAGVDQFIIKMLLP